MAWEVVIKNPNKMVQKWAETSTEENGHTAPLELSDFNIAEFQIIVSYRGEKYEGEVINFKVQKSIDCINWEDTGVEVTHTCGKGILSVPLTVTNMWYRIAWVITGPNKKYNFCIHIIAKR